MNSQQIAERLVAIHSALVDKTGEQPWHAPDLTIQPSGACYIPLYGAALGSNAIQFVRGASIEEALDAADAFIAAMPGRDETQKRQFQKNLGAVIDEGHALNMPTEVMEPLSQGMTALSENLLTHEAAE